MDKIDGLAQWLIAVGNGWNTDGGQTETRKGRRWIRREEPVESLGGIKFRKYLCTIRKPQ